MAHRRSSHRRDFYPRPPRGGRLQSVPFSAAICLFLSTPSARRATRCRICPAACLQDFYPRPPRGGRLHIVSGRFRLKVFLSTPSARRATSDRAGGRGTKGFLSTPSARRATARMRSTSWRSTYFYPRPPRGGRPVQFVHLEDLQLFLSTPSARRATAGPCGWQQQTHNFYPRPPRGGRLPDRNL